MSIQHRRGNYSDFDKSKMLAGEFAVVLQDDPDTSDGKAVYMSFNSGSAKRLMTAEDARDIINNGIEAATQDVVDAITDATAQDVADAQAAQEAAEEAAEEAGQTLSNKADIDGSYPNLAAGQLLSSQHTTDQIPYFIRPTFSKAGDREYDTLVGGSVGWNQLVNFSDNTKTVSGITIARSENIKISYGGTPTTTDYVDAFAYTSGDSFLTNFVAGHKYLITSKSTDDNLYVVINNPYIDLSGNPNRATIYAPTSQPTYYYCRIRVTNGVAVSGNGVLQVTDLTLLLGSTIADYIYTLETATAGAGVAKLKSWGFFTKDYYPYEAGSLKSVEGLVSHDTVGFNQFDKSTAIDGKKMSPINGVIQTNATWAMSDYIKVIPNTNYYTNADGTGQDYVVVLFNNDKEYIGYQAIVTGLFNTGDARYIVVSTIKAKTSVEDLVVNLSWSGSRNGEYEPYIKHSYPLDSSLTLRGVPKKDSDGNLYYDGDVYQSDGTVQRRYGEYALTGDENITIQGTDENVTVFRIVTHKVNAGNANQMSNYGIYFSSAWAIIENRPNTFVLGAEGNLYLQLPTSVASTVEQFSALLERNPLKVVYELATPTTETADPFTNPQLVDKDGTEEYVSTGLVPVGHYTEYPADLRERLETIPDLPTTAGTYRLKVTVVSGKPVYEWVTE